MRQVTTRDPAWRFYSALAVAIIGTLSILLWVSSAVAGEGLQGPNGEHKVVVCKYVGTPGTDERLQTGQNPIVVDYHALLGAGFDGSFPFAFADAQTHSVAVQWTFDEHFSDLSVCPTPVGPPPCETDCGPPPCNPEVDVCGPPPCLNQQGDCPPPCAATDCGPPVNPPAPPVPPSPTAKQYTQDVQNGAEPGGG